MGSSRYIKIGVITLTVLLIVIMVFGSEKSPEREIGRAREAISEARAVKADIYSKTSLSDAITFYNRAMQLWKKENDRLMLFRNYSDARNLAAESLDKAKEARDEAISNSASINFSIKKQLSTTRELIERNHDLFSKLPLSTTIREENSKGRLLFIEAERAYKNGQLILCDEKNRESYTYLLSSYTTANNITDEYFKLWPTWNELVIKAVASSKRSKTNVVVVDKFARRCYIYSSGSIIAAYDVDLGRNWIGDKREMGDKATPEGVYKVIKMKAGTYTSYHKALLIDYPNSDDKARFNRAKREGLLQKDAEIGSLIEIHGKGGTGTDWTDGCIALQNRDMDKLYSMCTTGMSVIIVGSIVGLDTILKTELK